MNQRVNLTFGVELEALFKLKLKPKQPLRDASDVSDLLANHIQRGGINCETIKSEGNKYDKWIVDDDSSIEEGEDEAWGMEFISRKMQSTEDWKSEVSKVFELIQQAGDIVTIESSSARTHVHVSIDGGWDLESLRRLAKAVVRHATKFYEHIPAYRFESEYVRRNQFSEDVLEKLDECKDNDAIVKLVQPGNRYVAFNFKPIGLHGTVEFRAPPHVNSCDEAFKWISLTLALFWWCLKHDPDRDDIDASITSKVAALQKELLGDDKPTLQKKPLSDDSQTS